MRVLLFLAFLTAYTGASIVTPCASGPKFWCTSLSSAKLCGAVSHCIQTVWENEEIKEDSDSVCQICLDMVKQAREQLESNQTISDLRDVFEGSCKLIPIKAIQKECIKTADDFIPELVEALASQMNPQMVCSVAGLCNNARIDKLLEENEEKNYNQSSVYKGNALTCNNCNVLSNSIVEKFTDTKKDTVLQNIQEICGKMSSFSDACNSIILTHFDDFYEQVKNKLSPENVCHMSGVCSWKYHSHAESENHENLTSLGNVKNKDDLPCELCEQLVEHLRDVLVANTTEDEFKQVLQGLCNQTRGFKKECLSIVDEYYETMYEILVNNLDANGACFMIGICPKKGSIAKIIPPAEIEITITKLEDNHEVSNADINIMQKHINNLMETEMSTKLVEGGALCTLCEYFMHFVQEALTLPSNEKKIENDLKLICSKSMPKTLKAQCDDFVDMYSDAIVALLIQEMDPRQICPYIKMCSQNSIVEKKEKDIEDKPTCPLCLFAVQQVQINIKNNKSKENVEKVLNNLCTHFPNNKLKFECMDFVKTYTSELIDLLIQDFTPQQICVNIKLCESNNVDLKAQNIIIENKDTKLNRASSPECLLCKKVIELVEKELIGQKTKEDIMAALRKSCSKLKKGEKKCDMFVEKYGDIIADLILEETKPSEICKKMLYCSILEEEESLTTDQAEPSSCVVCELIMSQMKRELEQNKTQAEIEAALLNVCHKIPNNLADKCSKMIENSSKIILKFLESLPPKEICKQLKLCSEPHVPMEFPQKSYCAVCEVIISDLEQKLKDKKTKEEIFNICSKIPKHLSNRCYEVIGQYSDDILDMLDSVPPKEICSNLSLCSAVDISEDILECGICQGISSYIISKKGIELTKAELRESSCESVPSKYFEKCNETIEYYSQSINNLVKSNLSESEICTKIGKCFGNEGKHSYHIIMNNSLQSNKALVGANECTFGPSHWCSSKEVAEKCDLVEYCQKVWIKKAK